VSSARKIPRIQARLCNIKVLLACHSTVVIRLRWVSCKPYCHTVPFVARLALRLFSSLLAQPFILDMGPGSLIFPLRSCAFRIISRTERLPALPPSVNQHSLVRHNPPLLPACSDNLLSRNNPRTPCLVHSVMPVQVVQPREVPSAGWVKLRRNRRGDLVLSTRLSSPPSSQQRVALDPSIRLSHLRILACSGAAVHLHPKINRWAGLVCLIISVLSLTYRNTGGTGGFGTGSNTASTGLFGQTNTAQQPPAPTGLFGQNQPAGSAFGGAFSV
jgi:hypothetical protein